MPVKEEGLEHLEDCLLPASFDRARFAADMRLRFKETEGHTTEADFRKMHADPYKHGWMQAGMLPRSKVFRIAFEHCQSQKIVLTPENLPVILKQALEVAESEQDPGTPAGQSLIGDADCVNIASSAKAARVLLECLSKIPGLEDIALEDLGQFIVDPSLLKALGIESNPFSFMLYNANKMANAEEIAASQFKREDPAYDLNTAMTWKLALDTARSDPSKLFELDFLLELRNKLIPGTPIDAELFVNNTEDIDRMIYPSFMPHKSKEFDRQVSKHLGDKKIWRIRTIDQGTDDLTAIANDGPERSYYTIEGKTSDHAKVMTGWLNECKDTLLSITDDRALTVEQPEDARRRAIANTSIKLQKAHSLRDGNHRIFGLVWKNAMLHAQGLPLHLSSNSIVFESSGPGSTMRQMKAGPVSTAAKRRQVEADTAPPVERPPNPLTLFVRQLLTNPLAPPRL